MLLLIKGHGLSIAMNSRQKQIINEIYNNQATQLYFTAGDCCDDKIAEILSALIDSNNTSVTEIVFYRPERGCLYPDFGCAFLQPLSKIIETKLNVTKLIIINSDLLCCDIDLLLDALKTNKGLKYFALSGAGFFDIEAEMLADILKNNQTLEFVDISNNLISDKGACLLADSLKYNTHLRVLYIHDNIHVTSACTTFFKEALRHNFTLTELRLDPDLAEAAKEDMAVIALHLELNQKLLANANQPLYKKINIFNFYAEKLNITKKPTPSLFQYCLDRVSFFKRTQQLTVEQCNKLPKELLESLENFYPSFLT